MSLSSVAANGGKNHVRTLQKLGVLAAICEPTEEGKSLTREIAPGIDVYSHIDELLSVPGVRGVIIATPAETHAELAERALQCGMDVLVEKPLALDTGDARRLIETADHSDRIPNGWARLGISSGLLAVAQADR